MISQMDQIYSSAYFTIVAAAGQDAHTGLPGVSRFHRQRLQDLQFDGTHFVQLPRPGLATIMSSHWASRGWTFQECCLAGRRLIFTEDQTLFLCNKLLVVESVKPSIFRDGWLDFRFGHLIRPSTMHYDDSALMYLGEQLQEYSRRNISYDSDSLNAFLGVLHQWQTRLAKIKYPMSHLWGLPIMGTITHGLEDIGFYFSWHHTCRDAVRRPDFPSWSWAGWAGTKSFRENPIRLAKTEKEQDRLGIYISVKFDDQRTQTLADFHEDSVARTRKSQHYRPGPMHLLVTCAVVPIKVQSFHLSQDEKHANTEVQLSYVTMSKDRPENGNLLLFHISGNIQVGVPCDLDQQIQLNERLWGLILHQSVSRTALLVIKQVGEALYERVGMVYFFPGESDYACMLFLNAEGCLLDRVDLSGEEIFPYKFERRTVCLV